MHAETLTCHAIASSSQTASDATVAGWMRSGAQAPDRPIRTLDVQFVFCYRWVSGISTAEEPLLSSKGEEKPVMRFLTLCLILGMALTGSACVKPSQPVTQRNSQLTQGNVQMNLIVGQTTKTEVLETFGAPNITTRDGVGREVWTYQRAAQVAQSSRRTGYWTVILAGQSGASSGFESSSSMITLIIKFDQNDVVHDFRSRTSNF